ncbi:hypothetical protein RvY_14670 [Ramazzottius varieornatus]|uniref:Transmembrane protein 242 n=1 Tax=Ramazzottius varieornatus TaxID=947166 RepID=A0A1D1VTZ7_RAMVA|nr:hypothetical protein RvY_14670 [Ramazzottius varieornatus]
MALNSDGSALLMEPHLLRPDVTGLPGQDDSITQTTAATAPTGSKSETISKAVFLGGVTFLGLLSGFGSALAMAKKRDPTSFDKGLLPEAKKLESGASFALRALGWGTLYAVSGVGLLCFTVYKILDVQSALDFRQKMKNLMPSVPKREPNPSERTEFASIREFFEYYGEEKRK